MSATRLGVVIPCFKSGDVISGCLDSLLASQRTRLEVVLCDNASPDETVATIRSWARGNAIRLIEIDGCTDLPADTDLPGTTDPPEGGPDGPNLRLTLVRSTRNRGFAGAVNLGLRELLPRTGIDLFWILNPDTIVAPEAASAYASRASEVGPFSLMGGRTLYREPPGVVQSDGGHVSRWTGACSNHNQGARSEDSVMPAAASLDFISGANMVASRAFVETVGLMREDYFLYYEEVDWAFRRGDLPLAVCPESVVVHHGGTSIGTGSVERRPSPFANYYNFRNRVRFVVRFMWPVLPISYGFSLVKILQLLLLGARDEAFGALRGLHQLPPPPHPSEPVGTGTARSCRMTRQRRRYVIVNFHGLGKPPATIPTDELPYWVSRESFEQILDRIVELRRRGHDIRITFDDGNRSDIEIAAPALEARDLTADFFVLTGRIGEADYLDAQDLRNLVAMGMGIGLHGRDHVDWRRLDAEGLRAETVTARDELARIIGTPVTMVGVPFGAYDHRVLRQLSSAGYSAIHTSDGGTATQGSRIRARTSIRSDMGTDSIERILTGTEPATTRLKRSLSTTARRQFRGRVPPARSASARSLWTRLMLRNTAFTGKYGKLRRLYSVEDPWHMESEREQYRFEQTNEMLRGIAPRFADILELGSGEGHQSVHLAAMTNDLVGLELSERAVERARARCPEGTFRVGGIEDVETIFAERSFDLIVACEVLYYTRDLDSILGKLQERSKRVFVSNYQPRSTMISGHFEGRGWRRLPEIRHGDTVWECFLWEAP